MTDPETPEQDEPTGPAAWAARLFGRPMPTTDTPQGPEAWHRARYNREDRA